MEIDVCQIDYVVQKRVAKARKLISDEQTIEDLAGIFKILSEPTRVRILQAISEEELCVCDIAAIMQMIPSAISHQLRILRSARLVKARKNGKMVYYTLDDDHVRNLFSEGIRHLREE